MAGRNALVIAAGIATSRLLGLVRERVIAHVLGLGPEADALRAALKIPNLLQNLLGEGTLSASFLPAYVRRTAAGPSEAADRLASSVFAALLVVAGALVIAGVAVAPGLVALLAPGFVGDARFDLAVPLVRLTFPMTGLLVLSAWALGVLNAHRRFAVPYLAPVAWNLCIIAAFVWAADDAPSGVLHAVGLGCVAGGAAQFLVQLPFVLRHVRPRWPSWDDDVRGVLWTAVPAVWGRGVVQISGYVDHTLATLLGAGSVAALSSAQTLILLPSSLFGLSVAQAALPELATASMRDGDAFARHVRSARSQALFFAVPSAVALAGLGDVLVAGLLQTGAFGQDDVRRVAWILVAASPGVVSGTTSRVTVAALSALGDTRSPARSATFRVLGAALLGCAGMAALEPIPLLGWATPPAAGLGLPGVAALAAAASIGSVVEAWWLSRRLTERASGSAPGWGPLVRHLVAAVLAVGAARAVAPLVDAPWGAALAAILVFGTVWAGGLALWGPEEDRRRLRRLVGRRRVGERV